MRARIWFTRASDAISISRSVAFGWASRQARISVVTSWLNCCQRVVVIGRLISITRG
jgi:hypothetical protein